MPGPPVSRFPFWVPADTNKYTNKKVGICENPYGFVRNEEQKIP